MAIYADRVKETTTTTGTGIYTLGGAATGFRTFISGVGTGRVVTYCAEDGTNWEIGEGTITSGTPDTLSRTTILASSGGGAAISWSTGAKNIFLTSSATRLATLDKANTFTGTVTAPTFVGALTGSVSSYVGDAGTIIQSYNASASNAAQLTIKHTLAAVDIYNSRGTINLTGNASTATSATTAGTATSATTAGTVTTAAQPSITSVGNLLSLSVSGTSTLPVVNINTQGTGARGIQWYNNTYTAWVDYMAESGTASNGPSGTITAPTGTLVTSWGKRNFIEHDAGYGWTFESGTNSSTTPAIVAEIRSSDGAAKFTGTVTAPAFVGSGASLTSIPAGNLTGTLPNATVNGGTYSMNISGYSYKVYSPDGDRLSSTKLPTTSPNQVRFDFVTAAQGNGTGNYCGLMTYAPWFGDTVSTGDSSYQLSFGNNSGVNASGMPKLSLRNGIDSTWNSWYTLIHSGTIGSQAVATAGTVTTAAQPAITSVGTLTSLAVTGTITTNSLEVGTKILPQVSQSVDYTLVLSDSGKHILHPSADTTARTFTIPANSSVAYPIGTSVTFINQNAGGSITIAITTDTMRLAGAGTTGSRTLTANGVATAVKIATTEWIIFGTNLA